MSPARPHSSPTPPCPVLLPPPRPLLPVAARPTCAHCSHPWHAQRCPRWRRGAMPSEHASRWGAWGEHKGGRGRPSRQPTRATHCSTRPPCQHPPISACSTGMGTWQGPAPARGVTGARPAVKGRQRVGGGAAPAFSAQACIRNAMPAASTASSMIHLRLQTGPQHEIRWHGCLNAACPLAWPVHEQRVTVRAGGIGPGQPRRHMCWRLQGRVRGTSQLSCACATASGERLARGLVVGGHTRVNAVIPSELHGHLHPAHRSLPGCGPLG